MRCCSALQREVAFENTAGVNVKSRHFSELR